MKKILCYVIIYAILLVSCTHPMHITNSDQYISPPLTPTRQAIKLGVTSSSISDPKNSMYIAAIVDALQKNSTIERVIYPYNQAVHKDMADAVVDISVNVKYDGDGSNFFVNFPGWLIFAPAIWGYGYSAEIETMAAITSQKDGKARQITVPTIYHFRQAAINRTWTEVSWFEVGIIALVGGVAFTSYDTTVTNEFIQQASPNYGPYVAKKIVSTACECLDVH